MKYILLSFSLLVFACNNSNKSTPATEETTATEETNSTPEPIVNQGPQAYFSASGSDWNLELLSEMSGTFPFKLTMNNGDEIQATLRRVMEGNAKPASGKSSVNFTGVATINEKGEVVELGIVPGECSGKNGEKTNFTCKLSIGKKTYSGCGNYSED